MQFRLITELSARLALSLRGVVIVPQVLLGLHEFGESFVEVFVILGRSRDSIALSSPLPLLRLL